MSCDLNLRGVKRKLSTEAECDSIESSVEENDQRRRRLDDSLDSSGLTRVGNVSLINDESKSIDPSSPNSLSSRSISDDEDDSEDEEDEFLEDDSFPDQLGNVSHGLASAESESGYDERASSNSSLSSTSSDSDFTPTISTADSFVLTSIASNSPPIFSRNLSASPSNSSTFASPVTSVTSNTKRNSLNDSPNQAFCAYNMPPVSARRSTPPYVQSRSYVATNKDSSHYLRKRQQIFNLSLCKLSRFRQSSDPSLLRSVLICNTLRMLEKELEREGVKINFGPNGVSFISPVPSPSPDLDFVPVFQSPSTPSISYDCASTTESVSFVGSSSATENQPYSSQIPYPPQCDSSADSCSEYDKYFSVESGSSGRATPFLKNFTSSDYPPSRTGEPNINSAFWTNGDEQVPDRLSSLNWSSMLTFNNSSSSTSPSEISSDSNTRHLNQPRPEVLSTSAMMSYPEQPEQPSLASNTNAAVLTSSCESPSSNSVTLATLLPPASTPSSSSPSLETNPLLVSQSASSDSYLLPSASSVSSTYFSAASSLPPYSSNPSPAITQQACGTSSPSSSTSFANAPSLMSTSYMNSYLSYSTNTDEIFGDIDLSLYDFDIFSPLSPPSVANKSSPIMSAEELIRNINSSESNSGPCSSSTSSLLSISHYSVNGFSGQSYTSSNYCTSSSSMTNVVSSITTSSSAINSQLMMSQTVTMPSPSPVNCGSSSAGTGIHMHSASGRYYKTPEERDQQTMTTIKCHN